MKLKLQTLDKFILFLIGFTVLVDMVNGFFMMNEVKLPISQTYKFVLMFLMLLRLHRTKDILFVILIFIGFQIAPIFGLLKTGDFSTYLSDVIAAAKWFNVPLSFFYFKTIFQSDYRQKLNWALKNLFMWSFFFLAFNLTLGVLGFGQAFYFEGYGNASGTKGFIYAGNELTILVLAIGFVIASHHRYLNQNKKNILFFILFLLFAFAITSKTVLAGVILVFLIPYMSSLKLRFHKKWVSRIIGLVILGIPATIAAFYIAITKTGIEKKLQNSAKINNNDFLTTLLSNRNNFVVEGWHLFVQDYSGFEKIVGLGQGFYVAGVKDVAEIDFVSLLFAAGVFGLLLLLLVIFYYFLNARLLMQVKNYVHAKSVFVFLVFLCIAANLAGHIFDSGIAGFYIGASIALMFYRNERYL